LKKTTFDCYYIKVKPINHFRSVKRKMFSLQAKRTAFNYSNRASSQMLTRTALMAPSVTASSTPVDFQKRQFYGMIYKLMKQKNQNEN